ncbi:MAG: PAS domain S-box protein [Methanomicrobiales archaeon]|nr:PAS domain S-box protein [Methanomicrobiales archaeon]
MKRLMQKGWWEQHIWGISIFVTTVLSIVATVYSLSQGITDVFPHLFYIPIVLAAYWNPRRAIHFALALGFLYLLLVALFTYGSIGPEPLINAGIRTLVFVWVAAVIAYLSGRVRAEQLRYQGIFDSSNAGVCLIRLSSRTIQEANPRFAAMLGYSREELAGRPFHEIARNGTSLTAFFSRISEGSTVTESEMQLQGRDGKILSVLVSSGRLAEDLAIFTAIDNTRQKEAEDLLRLTNEKLQGIIEFLPDATFVIDSEKRVIAWNRAIEEMTGVRKEEILGKSDFAYAVPFYGEKRPILIDLLGQEHQEMESCYERIERRGETTFAEVCVPLVYHGRGAYLFVKASPLYDASGKRVGAIESVRDVTDQKKAEGEIRKHNRELSIMNEIIGATTSPQTLDDILRTAAMKTVDLFGFSMAAVYLVDQTSGRPAFKFQTGMPERLSAGIGFLDAGWEPLQRVLSEGHPLFGIDCGTSLLPADIGLVSSTLIPLTAESRVLGAIFLGSTRRRTFPADEQVMLESIGRTIGAAVNRALLQQELELAYQRANLFLDIMAHDINNVNSAALGYAQILSEMGEGKNRDFAQRMEILVRQSVEIIKNVSTIRRIQEGAADTRPVDLHRVILAEIGHFTSATIHYPGTQVSVMADDLLPEIFTNLIGNSVKFGGPKVEVWITVAEDGGKVEVEVSDSGPGIPDDLKSHIFHRFQRGPSKKSGKGLGLYITRMLVEHYGGEIRVGDRVPGQPGQGAAFRFTLQRAP